MPTKDARYYDRMAALHRTVDDLMAAREQREEHRERLAAAKATDPDDGHDDFDPAKYAREARARRHGDYSSLPTHSTAPKDHRGRGFTGILRGHVY